MVEGLLQPAHLLLILIIVLIFFGPGKLPGIGSSLGQGIREFRQSINGAGEPSSHAEAQASCTQCGTAAQAHQRFCSHCGAALIAATTLKEPASTHTS